MHFPCICSSLFLGGIPAESKRINKNKTADCNGVLAQLLIKSFLPLFTLG